MIHALVASRPCCRLRATLLHVAANNSSSGWPRPVKTLALPPQGDG
jgi:hypothetical protein